MTRNMAGSIFFLIGMALLNPDRSQADEPSWSIELAVPLEKATFQIINEGVLMYNQGDTSGCYRLFQGSLISLSPFLKDHPDLKSPIDTALAASERLGSPAEKALELRKGLDKLLEVSRKRPVKLSIPPTVAVIAPLEIKPGSNPQAKLVMPIDPIAVVLKLEPKPSPAEVKAASLAIASMNKPASVSVATSPVNDEVQSPISKPAADTTTGPGVTSTVPIDSTLWNRTGGIEVMKLVVHDWIFKATNDPRVGFDRGGKFFVDDASLLRVELHILEFLSSKTGGPLTYRSRSLKAVHAGMAITSAQFKAILEDFDDVAFAHKIGPNETRQLLEFLREYEADLVSSK